jgi:hypothetical protein
MASACYRGLSLEEASEHEQGASLARLLDAKMQDRLKKSARITAIALNLHVPGLMDKLVEEWAKLRKTELYLLADAREEYGRRNKAALKRYADDSATGQAKHP